MQTKLTFSRKPSWKDHPVIKFANVSNLLPFAIIFAALVPVYQSRVESQREIAALKRDVVVAQETAESDPAAEETAKLIELNRQPLAGQSILEAKAAKKTIVDRRFEMISGYCSRYVRQTVEYTHGTKYSHLFGASATISAKLFLASPYGYRWPAEKAQLGNVLQPGDILFKVKDRYGNPVARGFGHVGIYVGDIPGIGKQLVAENSSTSIGRIQGAKGYRTLDQYGFVDVVGRLPLPASYVKAVVAPPKAPRLIIGLSTAGTLKYSAVKNAKLTAGRWKADSATLMAAAGRKAPTSQNVVVIEYLKAQNAAPYKYGQHLSDKSDPRTYLFIDGAR